MHRFLATVLAGLALGFTYSANPARATPGPAPEACADTKAIVAEADGADFADICAGAAAALRFLESFGVRATEPVSVIVTHSLPAESGPTAAGCYIEKRRQVYLLPYDAFRRHKTWFGVPISRSVYRALAAHEAAHAVAACNFQIPNPTIQAKEYLAYVTTFATMAPPLRSRALGALRPSGFSSLDRFTPVLYMFNPMRFGAEAYQHFSSATDQQGLVLAILAGQALTD